MNESLNGLIELKLEGPCGEFNEIEGWCMNMKSWPLKG